jgi:glycosyltransferase involved in cell wall biosynthesis
MTLIPAGFYPERFDIPAEKAGLRKAYGISPATFVVLAVAAINRSQKRADYLIDEMAGLPGDWLLMMDGSLDHGDPDLVPYARRKLGDRVRISHVASEKVAELYKLADVLVHVSRFEAFGIAIVEAASTGLPIITHDGPHFRWLIQTPASWINADRQGALAERIRQAMSDPAILESMRAPDVVRERFSWHGLKSDYGSLYRHVARLPRQGAPEADCRRVA